MSKVECLKILCLDLKKVSVFLRTTNEEDQQTKNQTGVNAMFASEARLPTEADLTHVPASARSPVAARAQVHYNIRIPYRPSLSISFLAHTHTHTQPTHRRWASTYTLNTYSLYIFFLPHSPPLFLEREALVVNSFFSASWYVTTLLKIRWIKMEGHCINYFCRKSPRST
jgi:hypothetical protein